MLQLWQAFVGVKARRVDKYYQNLLASNGDSEIKSNHQNLQEDDNDGKKNAENGKARLGRSLPLTLHLLTYDAVILSLRCYRIKFCLMCQIVACLCRICHGHFPVILLWMRMVEML